jgi:hypothetical protein
MKFCAYATVVAYEKGVLRGGVYNRVIAQMKVDELF